MIEPFIFTSSPYNSSKTEHGLLRNKMILLYYNHCIE